MSLPGNYPVSEFGGYMKSFKEVLNIFPDDGRFSVACHLNDGKTMKMSEARILYKNTAPGNREQICAQQCGQKCYLN